MSSSLQPHKLQHTRFLSFTIFPSLLKFMPIEPVMLSSHLILCHPFLLLPPIFPSIRVFSNESFFHIRWPKYWSFSISPSNEYSEMTGLISLLSKGLSRVFSSTVQKHWFFSAYPSLWFCSFIRSWLLEKPKLWLYRPLLAKWYFWFLTFCPDLS